MSARSGTESPRYWHDGLELLRGAAACSVLLFHCIGFLQWDVTGTPFSIFKIGWIGVDLFLVISGYVVSASAMRQCAAADYAGRFWRARLARIVPLYLVTSIVFLLAVSDKPISVAPAFQSLTHLLFIHNLFVDAATSINGVTWSLGLEMQLYVVVFFVIPRLARMKRGRVYSIYVTLLLSGLAYRYVTWSWLRAVDASDQDINHALTQLPGMVDSFALGSLVALFGPVEPNRARCALYCVAAGALLGSTYLGYIWNAERFWAYGPTAVLFRSLVAVFGLCAVLAALSGPKHVPFLLEPLRKLGNISYGIYLWHLIVLYLVQRHVGASGMLGVMVVLSATIALAGLSYKWIELPSTRWAHRVSSRSRPR